MKNLSLDLQKKAVVDQYGKEISIEAVKKLFERKIRFSCQVTILRLQENNFDLNKTIEYYNS